MILSDGINCLGYASAQDPVKKDSSEAVKLLKEMGITVHMVTGDNERTAAAAGRQTGIENITAAVMPEGKIKAVENLKKNGVVIFAGDGINDAPALASADVGAAFASGADIASEAGNVVLMKNSPLDIVKLIQISRLTVKKVKQNLFWAFIYNIIGIPVAAMGLLNPMIAGAAMAFSSVSVLLNSLSMQRSQRKKMRS
ncbi:MAG: putative copper-importing P-type ATPase A [Candidatus Aerophobetes bacterium ADurb.Bin490]|nr:MAG: putative copper-importing P-type ATPase A [Candidatus Aerophobetes bacterium ADurb.Bin490]